MAIIKHLLIQRRVTTRLQFRRAFSITPPDASDALLQWNKFSDHSQYLKKQPNGRWQRPIFVAATRQHVGKTTVSLALMSGLQKRYDKVGFLKP